MPEEIKTKVYHSTEEFFKAEWDMFHNGSYCFQYEFLKVMEASCINQSKLRFLTFKYNGQPKGAAVISRFYFDLPVLPVFPNIIKYVKVVFPWIFRLPVICCGLPVSFGNNLFCVLDQDFFLSIVDQTSRAMEEFADETGCSIFAWKEFPANFEGSKGLNDLKYKKYSILPNTCISVKDKGVKKYLNSLRSSYRRKFKKPIEKMGKNAGDLAVIIKPFTDNNVDQFYNGYQNLQKNSNYNLGFFPKEFFYNLIKYNIKVEILTVFSLEGSLSALLVPDKYSLNFILVATENKDYAGSLYAELIRSIVIYGLEKGFKKLKLGQSSYYSKMSAGANPETLEIYLKSNNFITQYILEKYGNEIFPVTIFPKLNPFK